MKYCKQQATIWFVVMLFQIGACIAWDEVVWDVAFWGSLIVSQLWIVAGTIIRATEA